MVNHYRYDFIGLSSESKPTPTTSEKVADGSTFYESNTSKLYVWYNDQWYEKTDPNAPTPYTLPIATSETLGGIKVGEGLAINSETGVLSAAGGSGPTVVQTTGTSTTDVMSQDATTKMVYYDSTLCSVKLGALSSSSQNYGVSLGRYAQATGDNAVAIGGTGQSSSYGTKATGDTAIAIGRRAKSENTYSIAIGFNASASNSGNVALGSNSSTTRQGEVNIGTSAAADGYNNTNYRVLGGVHDPINAHDAATKGYVDGLISAIEARLTAGGL